MGIKHYLPFLVDRICIKIHGQLHGSAHVPPVGHILDAKQLTYLFTLGVLNCGNLDLC